MKLILAIITLGLGGCVGFKEGQTPASPAESWKQPIPQTAAADLEKKDAILEIDPQEYARNWTLAELIDLALSNNSHTQATWLQTRAREAALGSIRGSYYPQVSIGGQATHLRSWATFSRDNGGGIVFTEERGGPYAAVDWILYDFGRRSGAVEELRQDLFAANYAHNAAIQEVIFDVQRAYFGYVAYKSLADSQRQAVKEAETNLAAAQARQEAGVATIADVLQAQTALARAKLDLETTLGRIKVVRGVVATAVGIPPTTAFDVDASLDTSLPVEQVSADIDTLMKKAQQNSPQLAQARTRVVRAEGTLERRRSEGLPTLAMRAQGERVFISGDSENTYNTTLNLSFPLFTGLSQSYNVLQAETEKRLAEVQLKDSWQQKSLAVWSSYNDHKTAREQIKASTALVKSAEQSYQVALGRYQEGVGNILDLLSAQTILENARSAILQSKADWLISLAQLKRDIGILDPTTATGPLEVTK